MISYFTLRKLCYGSHFNLFKKLGPKDLKLRLSPKILKVFDKEAKYLIKESIKF